MTESTILVVGGGLAGCEAALTLSRHLAFGSIGHHMEDLSVTHQHKRSICLASDLAGA